jgi:hypothetical protein
MDLPERYKKEIERLVFEIIPGSENMLGVKGVKKTKGF